MVLDISPTLAMYERTTMDFATLYYHWFFLIQPEPLPETLIGANPGFYLRKNSGAGDRPGLGCSIAGVGRVRALFHAGGDARDVRGLSCRRVDRPRARPH